MKKRAINLMLSFSMVLTLLFNFSATAYAADSSVTFADNKIIAFAPGSVYTDEDLFDNFKGVMPGDKRTEEITIENNTKDYDYIKVYLRAVPHDESANPISKGVLAELQADERRKPGSEIAYMHDFLAQLSMKVWNGTALIKENTADKVDGLPQNGYLGSIRKGETIQLKVELGVPIEMGNEYSKRIGEVDWQFIIEGFQDPAEPSPDSAGGSNGGGAIHTATLIQTGQLNWPIPVLGGLGILLAACGFMMIVKKRKDKRV